MTPLQIQMLLHYHTRRTPYAKHEPEHAESAAVHDQRQALVALGLIEFVSDTPLLFTTTDKGQFWVNYICGLPMPQQQWVMPTPGDPNSE